MHGFKAFIWISINRRFKVVYKICNRSIPSPKKKSWIRHLCQRSWFTDIWTISVCRDCSEMVSCIESNFCSPVTKKRYNPICKRFCYRLVFDVAMAPLPALLRGNISRPLHNAPFWFFPVNVLGDFSWEISFDSRRYCFRRLPFRNRISQRLRGWGGEAIFSRLCARFVESYRQDVFMIERKRVRPYNRSPVTDFQNTNNKQLS